MSANIMMIRNLITITLCAVVSNIAGRPIITYEQALQQHHVALTKAALIDAVGSSDPEVRWLAASKLLVNDHALDAIPSIESALAIEKVPNTRINTALALAQIGDTVGFSVLQSACDETGLSMALRLKAAGYLLFLDRESCLGTVKEALQPGGTDIISHLQALSVVPRFKHLSEGDSQELTRLVLRDLTSKEPAARLNASHTLALCGKTTAVPDLQTAMSTETDGPTRSQMQRDLSTLSRLQQKNQ
jgi:hypothetical protein